MKNLMAIALTALALNASAFTRDGNDLVVKAEAYTDDSNDYYYGMYQGVIAGSAAVYSEPSYKYAICYPKTVTTGQLAKTTAKWLKKNPELLHKNASYLIWKSHFDAFGTQQDKNCPQYDQWLELNS